MPIPKPKIVEFPVGPGGFATAAEAFQAASDHLNLLIANGNGWWAVPGWPGAGPVYHQPAEDPQSVGLYYNRFNPTYLDPPGGLIPDPALTNRIDFVSSKWVLS